MYDLDGVGSPVVINYLTTQTNDVVEAIYYTNNGDVEKTIDTIIEKYGTGGYKLFICDHSPVKSHYDKMVEEDIDFMIFDHHKSSEVQGFEHVVFDLHHAGTYLFFDYVIQEVETVVNEEQAESLHLDLYPFVYHVNDYDMWIHESPHSKRINELLYETSISGFVKRFSADPRPGFTDTEELIVTTAEKKREAYIDKAEKHTTQHTDQDGNRFGIVFAEQHQSQLGHELIDRLNIEYIFMVNAQASKVSIRSKGKVDVSEIAKHYANVFNTQGGGHKAAAGFGYTPEDLPELFYLLRTY
jgi:hypothetical protein